MKIIFLFLSIFVQFFFSSDIFVNDSKDDLTDIQDSDLKNPDVIPPIDGYSVGLVDRELDIMSDESAFHQQINQPINSISNNRVSMQTTINTQSIGNYVSLISILYLFNYRNDFN